ncbi:hypothetical protein Hanom_Chr10g00894231 [Helianthus anomalus]
MICIGCVTLLHFFHIDTVFLTWYQSTRCSWGCYLPLCSRVLVVLVCSADFIYGGSGLLGVCAY